MLDISPHVEQMIIAKAQEQGVSVTTLLERAFGDDLAEMHGLDADTLPPMSENALQAIYDDLDDDTPNPQLQALIKRYGGLNVQY